MRVLGVDLKSAIVVGVPLVALLGTGASAVYAKREMDQEEINRGVQEELAAVGKGVNTLLQMQGVQEAKLNALADRQKSMDEWVRFQITQMREEMKRGSR